MWIIKSKKHNMYYKNKMDNHNHYVRYIEEAKLFNKIGATKLLESLNDNFETVYIKRSVKK